MCKGDVLMKKLISVFLTIIYVCFAFVGAFAEPSSTELDNPAEQKYTPHGKCLLVCDASSGFKVYSKGSGASINPYGFTKILTAITVIENHYDISKTVTIPKDILKDYDYSYGNIGLTSGEKISVENLLYAMMLQDAGDCATALAHLTGKSYDDFIKLLNETAKNAGAENSVFTEPAGLNNSTQKTTLDDMYKICMYAFKNETFKEIVSTAQKTIPPTNKCKYNRNLFSKNKFLSKFYSEDYVNPNIVGVKEYYKDNNDTGLIARYTKGSDDLLILVAGSDKNDDVDYVYDDVLSLIKKGEGFFTEINLIKKEEFVTEIPLKTAKNTDRALIVSLDDINLRLPKEYDDKLITREIALRENIDAPLDKFETVGEIKIYYDKTYVGGAPVASYHKIERSSYKELRSTIFGWFKSFYFWIGVVLFLVILKFSIKIFTKKPKS